MKFTLRKRQFLKNNFIFMAGTLIGSFLGYLFHFIVSRQISIAQYGELQSLLSIFIIFGVFGSALSYFTIRHTSVFASHNDRAANEEFVQYLARKVSKFTLVFLLALIILSPLLAKLLHFSSLIGFVVISLATFFSIMTVIYSEVLRGWQQFFLLSLVGVEIALVKFASGAILATTFHTTAIISFSLLLSALAGWYLTRYYCRKKILSEKTEKNQTGWREKYFSEDNIRKSALNIFFFSLALVLVSNLDVVLVKYFSNPETAGYYGAFALLGKIVLWLTLPVVSVLLPEACAEGHTGKRPGKKYLMGSYGLMLIIGLAIILFYYLAPNFVINFFFGQKYILDTRILWLFGFMSFFLSLLTLEANLSFAKHDFRVVYFLTTTLIVMIASLARYHHNLTQIVLALSVSFLFGYMCILILNLSSHVIASEAKQSCDL